MEETPDNPCEPLRDCFLELFPKLKELCTEWQVGPSPTLWLSIEPAISNTELVQLEDLAQKLTNSSPDLLLKVLLSWLTEQVPLLKYIIDLSLRDLTGEESNQLKELQESLLVALQQQHDVELNELDLLLAAQKDDCSQSDGDDFHSADESEES
jgi:hypothetical protein